MHFSEHEAYHRITVARASREHPMLLAMLADGRLHLTAIGKLVPHLTRENRDRLLKRATHRSKRQVEELIAEVAPRPDVPAVVRKLPERRTLPAAGQLVVPKRGSGPLLELGEPTLELRPDGVRVAERAGDSLLELGPDRVGEPDSNGPRHDDTLRRALQTPTLAVANEASAGVASPNPRAAPTSPSVIQPLSPGRYKVQFTASTELRDKLERLRRLLGAKVPNGDLAAVIEQAVTEKLERLEARRFARTKAPRKGVAEKKGERSIDPSPTTRHIPAAVRRAVHERDGSRCRYVDEQGRRCPERDRLEYHHRHTYGLGGAHTLQNIGLVCPAHNAHLADCDYGREAMAKHRRTRSRTSSAPGG